MITSLNEFKQTLIKESNSNSEIAFFLSYPNLTTQTDGFNVDLYINNKNIGFFRFTDVIEIEDGEYIVTEAVEIKDEFKRKGIYSAVIEAGLKYAQKHDLNGVASLQYDLESGEQERSDDANMFWESLVSKGKAEKIEWFDGEEDSIVYLAHVNTNESKLNENSFNEIEISINKLKQMFDEYEFNSIISLKDNEGVYVDGPGYKQYNVSFKDGKYYINDQEKDYHDDDKYDPDYESTINEDIIHSDDNIPEVGETVESIDLDEYGEQATIKFSGGKKVIIVGNFNKQTNENMSFNPNDIKNQSQIYKELTDTYLYDITTDLVNKNGNIKLRNRNNGDTYTISKNTGKLLKYKFNGSVKPQEIFQLKRPINTSEDLNNVLTFLLNNIKTNSIKTNIVKNKEAQYMQIQQNQKKCFNQ